MYFLAEIKTKKGVSIYISEIYLRDSKQIKINFFLIFTMEAVFIFIFNTEKRKTE